MRAPISSLYGDGLPFFAFSIGALGGALISSIRKNYHIPGRKKVLTQ
jgi:hypothetical protein